ncbi:MAG: hypothetical protein JW797_13655 [Bradymonadales bacterium]|nr:hypothetical protein [Bradymonadales bacterium]
MYPAWWYLLPIALVTGLLVFATMSMRKRPRRRKGERHRHEDPEEYPLKPLGVRLFVSLFPLGFGLMLAWLVYQPAYIELNQEGVVYRVFPHTHELEWDQVVSASIIYTGDPELTEMSLMRERERGAFRTGQSNARDLLFFAGSELGVALQGRYWRFLMAPRQERWEEFHRLVESQVGPMVSAVPVEVEEEAGGGEPVDEVVMPEGTE